MTTNNNNNNNNNSNILKLTPHHYSLLEPMAKIYSAHALPIKYGSNKASWNSDEWFVTLDRKKNEMKGCYIEWNEEEQEWEDNIPMSVNELEAILNARELVLV
jgi:hypothetical protein